MMKIQMGNLNKDAVLKVVQMKGPVIPNDVRKELGGENLIIGAILSELSGEGKVKVTNTKVGGTPAYYCPGAEARLVNMVKYLNEKDRNTAEVLKQKKVLKDSEQTPLLRVSLRNIKDFAKPLEVNIKGQKEIYWKWFLTPTQEAEQIIFKRIKPAFKLEIKAPEPTPIIKKEAVIEQKTLDTEIKKETKPAEVIKVKEKIKERKELLVAAGAKKEERKEEVQKELGISAEELEREKDVFFKKVREYFKTNDIQIIDYKIIRKKSEIEFTIAVPSRIGSQEYYCKAKGKAKVNDGDLSTVYVQGQAKKLPVIFITTGELTKKAKDMLSRDFKGMVVKRI
jgi:hypothetical protein